VIHQPDSPFGCTVMWGQPVHYRDMGTHVCNRSDEHDGRHQCKCGAWFAAGSATPEEPKCNGMCFPASDFIDRAPLGAITYAHPECPLHGDPEAVAGSTTPEEDTEQ
jgi:hypothetical protein